MHASSVIQSRPLFAIPWTAAHWVPLSIGFSRQEYRSGLPFLPTGDLPDPGMEPHLLCLLPWQADSTTGRLRSPYIYTSNTKTEREDLPYKVPGI